MQHTSSRSPFFTLGSGAFQAFFLESISSWGDFKIDDFFLSINNNAVTVLDQSNGAAFHGLRNDMSDQEPMASPREPPVGQQGNILPLGGAHNSRARLQHLRHARASLGALVPD